MVKHIKELSIFAASPADVEDEREAIVRVVEDLNVGVAKAAGFRLNLIRWETHTRPALGSDPQAIINQQVEPPDLVVAFFWKRLGTPTPRSKSGTAEEIETAINRWTANHDAVEVMVYFSRKPFSPANEAEATEQARLQRFKREIQSRGAYTMDYLDPTQFERLVRNNLTEWIHERRASVTTVEIPAVPRVTRVPSRRAAANLNPEPFREEIDARDHAAQSRVVAAIGASVRDWGFGDDVASRTQICTAELVANVRDHGSGNAGSDAKAWIEIEPQLRFGRSVSIDVYNRGHPFSIDRPVAHDLELHARGEPEHGFLAIIYWTGNLHYARKYEKDGLCGVGTHVYEGAHKDKFLLVDDPRFATAGIEADSANAIWIGGIFRQGYEFLEVLKHAVEGGNRRMLATYFKPLDVSGSRRLAIELFGRFATTETGRIRIESDGPLNTRSANPLFAAFEAYFPELFESGRVVFFSHEGSRNDLSEWAELWGLPHYLRAVDIPREN